MAELVQDYESVEWSFEDVCHYVGKNYSTVWRWYSERHKTGFPEPIRGGGKRYDPYYFNIEQVKGWWFMWTYTRRGEYPEWTS